MNSISSSKTQQIHQLNQLQGKMVVDSLVLYLINSKIFTLDDFTPPDERGGVSSC
ncbi:hypothetical protein H6G58_07030 [Arthrospira platensis FACHB-971]|uniref:CRISPR-associated protein Cas1 n=1 Tax=Limnospira platensis NIES-46 TaxID=1236695 RepID=A0A5M3TCZ6_LIMPL|nr:hypothetical protein [Arthrospira platensis]MBD2572782.1 hypothetical protein [Arthrospira platensis FACHB-971]MDT9184092.1 hypothetical protein [Limnospira sp. PMC 289.06]BAI92955.1 CRISPR-associated protein Cas1 [Arthrospira platensis NIES-39]BDT15197.1 CRISPR-associated protein Cas1 [Arthrospira platensis NIES-39]GCE95776.1 CRISPR-associated protein Cas1 [Arthrospira platensis NIES-46]